MIIHYRVGREYKKASNFAEITEKNVDEVLIVHNGTKFVIPPSSYFYIGTTATYTFMGGKNVIPKIKGYEIIYITERNELYRYFWRYEDKTPKLLWRFKLKAIRR